MSLGEQETTLTNPVRHPKPDASLFTWVVGGAALIVALTAGALFLGPAHHQTTADSAPMSEHEEQDEGSPTAHVDALAQKDPLELTALLLDARERAKLWKSAAILSSIELVIENGTPRGPIVFEFGEAAGPQIAGGPVSAIRYSVSYEGKNVTEEPIDSSNKRVGLPEPNCPLEVAFRTLTRAGVSATSGRVGVFYRHSQKHGKPVWLMTDEQGQATSLNADSCALLRR